MTVKASMVMGYRIRLLIIGLMLLLFAIWCAYDGFLVYPAQRDLYNTYNQVTQNEQLHDYKREWAAYAQEHNLPTSKPYERDNMDIYTQYIMGALLLPPGLFFVSLFFITGGRWYGVDDQGLHTSAGKHVTWDQISDLDKTRWHNKGIVVVHFKVDGGKFDRITLDDWKYQRTETAEILQIIEQRTGMGGEEQASADETDNATSDGGASDSQTSTAT